jgi:pimeloyl-ACP methyl ester carboxylesterase
MRPMTATPMGIGRAAVVGLSMGGRVAQHLVLAHPEAVAALVLVAAAADGATVTAELTAGRAAFAAALARGARNEAAEAFLRLWVDGPRRGPDQLDQAVRERARIMALDARRTSRSTAWTRRTPCPPPPSCGRSGCRRWSWSAITICPT